MGFIPSLSEALPDQGKCGEMLTAFSVEGREGHRRELGESSSPFPLDLSTRFFSPLFEYVMGVLICRNYLPQ